MAGYRMSPLGAAQTSAILDELQLPRQLPDSPVERQDGLTTKLWDVASKKRNVVTVYAPWCPACQKELPLLSEALSEDGQLVVLISQRQNREKVQEQLNNLGLSDLPYYRDITGQILRQGKVTKLPTTFLLRDFGTVMNRLVGFSEYRLTRLIEGARHKTEYDDGQSNQHAAK